MRYLLIAALAVLALLAGEQKAEAVHSSNYTQLVNMRSFKCMDVEGASLEPHAKVIQYNCHGGGNEVWQVSYVGTYGGYQWHTLKNQLSGLCLDVTGRSLLNNTQLQQFTCNSDTAQQFTVAITGSTILMRARVSGKCIQAYNEGLGDGVAVVQMSCTSGSQLAKTWQSRQARAVENYLYEPTGWGSDRPSLNCGWHQNCWPVYHEPDEQAAGLDWDSESIFNEVRTFTRLRTNDLFYSGNEPLGQMVVTDGEALTGCNSVLVSFLDRWGDLIGQQAFYHTDHISDRTINTSTNALFEEHTGYYTWPDYAWCPTSGPHTHVEYWNRTGYYNAKGWQWFHWEGESSTDLGPIWSRWQERFTFNR